MTPSRRTAAFGSALGIALLMSWWSWLHFQGQMGYTTLYTDASREGREVVLSLVRVAEIHGPAHYAVEKGALRFEVRGPTAELLVGSEVSIGGVWRGAQGGLEQTWVEDRTDGRRGKRWLGGVGLLLVFGVFGTSVRWTREGLALRG